MSSKKQDTEKKPDNVPKISENVGSESNFPLTDFPESIFSDKILSVNETPVHDKDIDEFDAMIAQMLGETIKPDETPTTQESPVSKTPPSSSDYTTDAQIEYENYPEEDYLSPDGMPEMDPEEDTTEEPEEPEREELPDQQRLSFDIVNPLEDNDTLDEEPEPIDTFSYSEGKIHVTISGKTQPDTANSESKEPSAPEDTAAENIPAAPSQIFESVPDETIDKAHAVEPSTVQEEKETVAPAHVIDITPTAKEAPDDDMIDKSVKEQDTSASLDDRQEDGQNEIILDEYEDVPEKSEENDEKVEETLSQGNTPASDPSSAEAEQKPKLSPLDAIIQQTQNGKDPTRSNVPHLHIPGITQPSPKEKAINDDDIAMFLSLGYESDITQKVGADRVSAVKYSDSNVGKKKLSPKTTAGYTGIDLSSVNDADSFQIKKQEIQKKFKKDIARIVRRITLTAFLTLLIFITDLLPFFHPAFLSSFPIPFENGMYGICGLALLLLITLTSRRSLFSGLTDLLDFTASPASIPALLVFVTVMVDTISLFDAETGILLNTPTALCVLFLAINDLMIASRNEIAFEVVATKSQKYIVEENPPKKKKVVRDRKIVKIINDNDDKHILYAHSADNIANFFYHANERPEFYRSLPYLILFAILASISLSLGIWIFSYNEQNIATVFLFCLQMTLPFSALIGYAYPFLSATKNLSKKVCTLIGEKVIEDFSGEKTIVIHDKDLLVAQSATEITIKGSGDNRLYVHYARLIFDYLDGTLCALKTTDTKEKNNERIEIVKVYEDGLNVRIHGKIDVLIGNADFLLGKNIRVPDENEELLIRRNAESCIMYLAFDGKIRVGYEITYKMIAYFEDHLRDLAECQTHISILSYDPNITNAFLRRSRINGTIPVGLIKPIRYERFHSSPYSDSRFITKSIKGIVTTLRMCHHLMANVKEMNHFYRITAVTGFILTIWLTVMGLLNGSASLIAVLLQALLCIPAIIASNKNIKNEDNIDDKQTTQK